MKHAPRGRLKARDPLDVEHPSDEGGPARCTARSKRSGVRCKRFPIPGGTVCRMHGGAAPQVKAKALERLQAYQNTAIDRLFTLVEQREYPSVAIAAVKDVLDRTMGKPKETLDVEHSGGIELSWKDNE